MLEIESTMGIDTTEIRCVKKTPVAANLPSLIYFSLRTVDKIADGTASIITVIT